MKGRAPKSAAPTKKNSRDKNPDRQSAPSPDSFPIVAIGASAGGLEAYTEFFRALPADTGMGFVLIQHLDPSHHSMLTEIIAKTTKMPVEEVRSGVAIQPNRVYVIPPNSKMAIADCVFQLSPRGKAPGQHLAVNFFMHSLAQEHKSRAIGIVLSGTGADGTAGLEDIKAEGGITFAQDPSSAKYDGMPRSAVDSGCVDFILSPKDIAKEIRRIRHHPYVHAERNADAPDGDAGPEMVSSTLGKVEQSKELADSVAPVSHEKDFTTILSQLRKTSGVDFSQYKPNTIHRRALRRMMILKLDSLREYAQYLKEHPDEGQKLYDDVLIPVTSFFRDFEAFEALKTQVYPAVVKDKASKGTIRM
ncbi:MAG: chemotaxis protein CheB [Acidobacteriaceae bacterium]